MVQERMRSRREEIINACEQLYATVSFREITIKEISAATSFSRPSIYNYFQTKEEIFLALFEREYSRWNDSLEQMWRGHCRLSVNELAERLAGTLAARPQLLKLLSMNLYDMEMHSRLECLIAFKLQYGRALDNISRILLKFCPAMTGNDIQGFLYAFFPFMFGVYPYTCPTGKQLEAMNHVGIDYLLPSPQELISDFIRHLLPSEASTS